MLAMLGGVLGVLFMIPLRRFLIVKEHDNLPYPEGTAAAQVLIAADAGGTRAKNVFLGLGIGALYKAITGFIHFAGFSLGNIQAGLNAVSEFAPCGPEAGSFFTPIFIGKHPSGS